MGLQRHHQLNQTRKPQIEQNDKQTYNCTHRQGREGVAEHSLSGRPADLFEFALEVTEELYDSRAETGFLFILGRLADLSGFADSDFSLLMASIFSSAI